jgi:hypothetical protein
MYWNTSTIYYVSTKILVHSIMYAQKYQENNKVILKFLRCLHKSKLQFGPIGDKGNNMHTDYLHLFVDYGISQLIFIIC